MCRVDPLWSGGLPVVPPTCQPALRIGVDDANRPGALLPAATARWLVSVVLPLPPLREVTAITCMAALIMRQRCRATMQACGPCGSPPRRAFGFPSLGSQKKACLPTRRVLLRARNHCGANRPEFSLVGRWFQAGRTDGSASAQPVQLRQQRVDFPLRHPCIGEHGPRCGLGPSLCLWVLGARWRLDLGAHSSRPHRPAGTAIGLPAEFAQHRAEVVQAE